jgi:hypothetical protein
MIKCVVVVVVLKFSYNVKLSECLSPGDFLIGFLSFGSMFCSNFALKFVDYPFLVLAKSAKILPSKIFSR